MQLNKYFYIFLAVAFFQMFFLQLKNLHFKKPSNCLSTFKSNNLLGLIIFVAIITGKF